VNNEGDRTTYEYDPAGRVFKTVNQTTGLTDALTRNDAGLPVSQLITWGPRLLYLFEHDYDLSGDMVKKVGWGKGVARSDSGVGLTPSDWGGGLTPGGDGGASGASDEGITRYAYDGMDRLTHVEYPDGRTVEYEFDDLGNRARMVEIVGVPGTGGTSPGGSGGSGGASAGQAVSQTTYTYDAGSRLLAAETVSGGDSRTVLHFGYDRNGNQVRKRESARVEDQLQFSRIWELSFDGLNRLSRVINPGGDWCRSVYDGDGLRAETADSPSRERFVYDGENVVVEATADGSIAGTVRGLRAISRAGGGTKAYFLHSSTGDVLRLVTSDGGDVIYRYDAFGNSLSGDGPGHATGVLSCLDNPFQYGGEPSDRETGYYYLRARFYDPAIGRFVSEDSWHGDRVRDPANSPLGNLPYAYCAGNPVRYTDPSGHNYLDINLTGIIPLWKGGTAGLIIDFGQKKVFVYAGVATGTPGTAASLTWSQQDAAAGVTTILLTLDVPAPIVAVAGGSVQTGIGPDGSSFLETGVYVGTPGANTATVYIIEVCISPSATTFPSATDNNRTLLE
jgi:RHS repeat-associated protein